MVGGKKVSIIIPLYNRKHLISRCVESVCRQTYRNLEIIVVDDGSTDGCEEVLETLQKADDRIIVIRKENGGVSSARNCGLDVATGDYVQFVDSDDALVNDATESAVACIEKNHADLILFWAVGEKIPANLPSVEETDDAVASLLRYGGICVPWNKLYRRDLIAENRFRMGVSVGEDLIFNLAYARGCGKISYIPRGLYVYEQDESGQSLIRRYDEGNFADVRAQWMAIKGYINSDCSDFAQKRLYAFLWSCYINAARKLCLRSGKSYAEIVSILRKWADDEMVENLPEEDCPAAWDLWVLRKRYILLVPFVVKLCFMLRSIRGRMQWRRK